MNSYRALLPTTNITTNGVHQEKIQKQLSDPNLHDDELQLEDVVKQEDFCSKLLPLHSKLDKPKIDYTDDDHNIDWENCITEEFVLKNPTVGAISVFHQHKMDEELSDPLVDYKFLLIKDIVKEENSRSQLLPFQIKSEQPDLKNEFTNDHHHIKLENGFNEDLVIKNETDSATSLYPKDKQDKELSTLILNDIVKQEDSFSKLLPFQIKSEQPDITDETEMDNFITEALIIKDESAGVFQEDEMESQPREKLFNCDICDYAEKQHLKTHVLSHNGEMPFICNVCDYKSLCKYYFEKHMRMHMDEKPFICNICDYKCLRKYYLQKHMMTQTVEKPFICNICDYQCLRTYYFEMHMKTHMEEKPLNCNFCNFLCVRKDHLKAHTNTHKKSHEVKPLSCNICGYISLYNNLFRRHMITHNTEDKPFNCDFCDYKCGLKSQFKTHMMKHTGEKSFTCTICDYKSVWKHSLQVHMMTHTGEKRFKCNICNYTSLFKISLTTHMMSHTGEKPFICNLCDYKCTDKSNLSKHMMIHKHEKTFNCYNCNYKSIRKNDLQKHMRKHLW